MLSAGPTPRVDLDDWELSVTTETGDVHRWDWAALQALPQDEPTVDLHCVTRWSKLATTWRGVSLDTLLADVETAADYVLIESYGGYTTNVPLEDLLDGQAWIAHEYDGAPLAAEHGGPARLLVPHLYLWKSAKWVRGLTLSLAGRAGLLGDGRLSQLRRPVARAAVLGRVSWRVAVVAELRDETDTARTLALDVADWPGHDAGQHVDVRLTAPDGYTAVRPYSIASGPGQGRVELTVEVDPNGEVSPYLARDVTVGEQLEIRGPLGGWFVWRPAQTEPVQLIAGGSGLVPLMSMLRSRAAADSSAPFRLLYSVRRPEAMLYADDLIAAGALDGVDVSFAYTREAPAGWPDPVGRVDAARLAVATWPPAERPTTYICGPTAFVETVADLLLAAGHEASRIRTERFG